MPTESKQVVKRKNLKKQMPSGNNYLFAIAIDNYQHAPTLSNCVRDAKGFIKILTEKYDFEYKKGAEQLIFTLLMKKQQEGIFSPN